MIEYTVRVDEYSTRWYLNGQLHREDGPAVEWASGDKFWCLDGKYHRVDGPALEYADGTKSWYLNDKVMSEADFNKRTQAKELTVNQLEGLLGYKIKVVGE